MKNMISANSRQELSFFLWKHVKEPWICNWLDHWFLCNHDWYIETDGKIRCVRCYLQGLYVKGGKLEQWVLRQRRQRHDDAVDTYALAFWNRSTRNSY